MKARDPLGRRGRDKLTGFVGVVDGRAEYLTGRIDLRLVPTVDEHGHCRDAEWFDETRVELLPEEGPQIGFRRSARGPR